MHSVNHFAMYVGHYASHLKLNTVLNVNYTSINWKEKKSVDSVSILTLKCSF